MPLTAVFQAILFMTNTFCTATSYLLYAESKRTLENLQTAENLDPNALLAQLEKSPNKTIDYGVLNGTISSSQNRWGSSTGLLRRNALKAINIVRDIKKYGRNLQFQFPFSFGEYEPPLSFPLFQSTFSFGLSRFKFTPFYLTFPNNVPAIPVQIAPSMWIDELHSDSQSYEFQKLVTQSFGLASSLKAVEGIINDGSIDIGAEVTVFGQMVLKNGEIIIQATGDGNAPSIFSKLAIQEIVQKQQTQVFLNKMLLIAFVSIWLYMAGSIFLYDIKRHQTQESRMQLLSQILDQDYNNNLIPNSETVMSRKNRNKQHHLCVSCFINERDVLLTCGHVCLCNNCAKELQGECPICHKKSTTVTPAYIC